MDRIEIRLLGPLRVRRSGGSLVDPHAWRTRKSADLLMLMALHAGEPVPVDRLLAALWPDSTPDRGRASLRTALSRLRSALNEDPFQRDPRGPVLSGVWVDSQVFDELAARAHRSWSQARPDEALAAATEADSLCLCHLVPDGDSAWASQYRDRHNALHRELLGDAGEAALSLLRPREAAEFADRLVVMDPFNERACRTLMLAATAIGEVDRALQAYQSLARRLADELGADPSSQTRAVYLQVLRAGPVAGRPVPFVGRDAELETLCDQLARPGGGRMLIVHGRPGMGTTRLLEQALGATETGEVVRGFGAQLSALLDAATHTHQTTGKWPLLAVDHLHEADAQTLASLEEAVLSGALALATCPTTHLAGPTALATALVRAGAIGVVWKLRLPPLTEEALRELASVVLAGEPGDKLVEQLARLSRGRPGKAMTLLEEWLTRGRVVGSGKDLALVSPGTTSSAAESRQMVARLQERIGGPTYDVLEAAATLGEHAGPDLLATMTGLPVPEVLRALDELADLSVVARVGEHLQVRDPLLQTAILEWLRPSVRRALHRRAAALDGLSHEARAGHWRAADVPGQAASCALAAAEDLASAGRLEEACERLRRALAQGTGIDAALRLHMTERLGDYLAQHGAGEAAGQVYNTAVRDAGTQGLEGGDRLAGKSQAIALGRRRAHLSVPDTSHGPPSPVPDPHELEHQLRVRIESARRAAEHELAVLAQIELCTLVLTPQRRLDELARVAAEARYLAPTAQLRAKVVLAAAEPEVLLGGASRWVCILLEAVTSAPEDVGLATGLPPGRLLALAMHDLGQDSTVGVPRGGGWLVARILLERGDVSAAAAALGPAPPAGGQPLAVVLDLVTRAQLLLLQEDRSGGRELLRQALDLDLGLGASLLLPEVAARLAAEEVDEDEEAALEHLDLAELTLGEVALPRERVTLLLGRAAVRAKRKGPRAAVDVASSAAQLATKAGLVHLADQARQVVAGYEQAPLVVVVPQARGQLPLRASQRR